MPNIKLAISTCPNDTFAFDAIIRGLVDFRGLTFDIQFLDIQQLNAGLFAGKFDVAKTSFHAALKLTNDVTVLPSGSALGFGVGPLLLAASPETRPMDATQVTLCPGEHTTAALLFRLFYENTSRMEHVVFSDIMSALKKKHADFGVCIHEGRFTWHNEGLSLVEDLGTRWEQETGCPLPLGGLVARKHLPDDVIAIASSVISESIQHGLSHRTDTLPTMRQHAQEFGDDVLLQHVDLYVNEWTLDLGTAGRRALIELSDRAKQIGLVDENAPPLEVFDPRSSA